MTKTRKPISGRFEVGDYVEADMPPYFGDEYEEGDRGYVVESNSSGILVRRENGAMIVGRNGRPFWCCPRNWRLK